MRDRITRSDALHGKLQRRCLLVFSELLQPSVNVAAIAYFSAQHVNVADDFVSVNWNVCECTLLTILGFVCQPRT